MSYSSMALGADSACVGRQPGAVCAPRSHCDSDLVCVCDATYGVHPTTGNCVLPSELCAEGTTWLASSGKCVPLSARPLLAGIENAAWMVGGVALGVGALLLFRHRRAAATA